MRYRFRASGARAGAGASAQRSIGIAVRAAVSRRGLRLGWVLLAAGLAWCLWLLAAPPASAEVLNLTGSGRVRARSRAVKCPLSDCGLTCSVEDCFCLSGNAGRHERDRRRELRRMHGDGRRLHDDGERNRSLDEPVPGGNTHHLHDSGQREASKTASPRVAGSSANRRQWGAVTFSFDVTNVPATVVITPDIGDSVGSTLFFFCLGTDPLDPNCHSTVELLDGQPLFINAGPGHHSYELFVFSQENSLPGALSFDVSFTIEAASDGGCCVPLEGCTVASASSCASQEGTFLGGGSSCSPNPCDSDADGLTDLDEILISGTNHLSHDTDEDGLLDPWEVDPDVPGAGFHLTDGQGELIVPRDDVFGPYSDERVNSTDPFRAGPPCPIRPSSTRPTPSARMSISRWTGRTVDWVTAPRTRA